VVGYVVLLMSFGSMATPEIGFCCCSPAESRSVITGAALQDCFNLSVPWVPVAARYLNSLVFGQRLFDRQFITET
ncbi:hypothetical protein, partial [Mesorhizobium sp.]|uniref:hypothetical protein n=1 Tax=Mesorhizobium sp. TaxID=1871066 RepID=UPI0025FE01DC